MLILSWKSRVGVEISLNELSPYYWECNLQEVDLNSFESIEDDRTGYFLHQCVDECNKLGLSRTHFLVKTQTSELIGFIVLSAVNLSISKKYGPRGEKEASKDKNDFFPMIKIDQTAVSKPFIRKKVGNYMVNWLTDLIRHELSPKIGFKYIFCEILDKESNIKFFKDYLGFIVLPKTWRTKTHGKKKVKISDERSFGTDKKLKTIAMVFDLKIEN